MKNIFLIIFSALLSASAMHADDKVGLVLSGGGARGIAHVGVIKALEDNDIPVDYVTGTSMGAVVGSFYCCGWTPDSMMNLITSKDFHYWSTGIIDRNRLTLVSCPDPTPEWINFSFGGEKPDVVTQVMPKSLVNPTPMNIEFLRLYTPYTKACGGDFDRLFVPFRCVFSDVYKKHKVICSKGSLGRSVRGSMSFPLVYRSIEVDSILAFDGGIYDNFPVDVMHDEFNPDFIIGVSVSKPDGKPNVNDMYSELEDLIIQNNDYSLDPELGIKIQVPVSEYGVLSFDKAREIYDIGYRTGLEFVDSIKSRIAVRRQPEVVNERRRRFAGSIPEVTFDSVITPGLTGDQKDYLVSVFQRRYGSDRTITMRDVERSYYDAVSQGDIDEILPEGRGDVLELKATVKHPWRASAGGWLSTGVGSFIFAGLGYHTLDRNSLDVSLSLWGGQSYCAAQVKGRLRLGSYNPSYVTLEGLVSRKKYYDGLPFFFSNDSIGSFISHTNFVRGAYEVGAGRSGLVRLSAAYGSEYKVRTGKAVLEYEFNTLGTRTFPVTGRNVHISVSAMHMESRMQGSMEDERERRWKATLNALWNNYYSISQYFSVGAMARGGISVGRRLSDPKKDLMMSEAFVPLESMDNCYLPEMRGDDYVAIGAIPVWSPMSRLQVRGEAYAYSKFRDATEWRAPFRKTEFIGRVSVVGTLSFATISLSASYSTPLSGWNFGVALGWYVPAPRL